jgi:hypothetical protein
MIGKLWNSYIHGTPEPIEGIIQTDGCWFRTFKFKGYSVEVFDCEEDGTINFSHYTGKFVKFVAGVGVWYLHVKGIGTTLIYEIISAPLPPEEDLWI